MGTSSIFNGQNNRNPLLPPDFNENESIIVEQPAVTWKTVKSDMTKYITSGGRKGSARHILKQYIKASGGAHRILSSSSVGVLTGGRIGSFFQRIQDDGIESTLQQLGIQYQGHSVVEVFSMLVEVLSPSANTKDDCVAREAVQDALAGLFDYVEENGLNLDCLNHIPESMMNKVMCNYITAHIWICILKDLGSRFEKYMSNVESAYTLEQEFKEIIAGIVEVEFNNQGTLLTNDSKTAVEQLSQKCLRVLEGII